MDANDVLALGLGISPVGPEFSNQLIMLKESFRQVMICRHEPGYISRDLLPYGCVAFSPFPTARGRCASPSALRVPGDVHVVPPCRVGRERQSRPTSPPAPIRVR